MQNRQPSSRHAGSFLGELELRLAAATSKALNREDKPQVTASSREAFGDYQYNSAI